MPKKYDYYLFDWDGCLARTLDVWMGAHREAFAEYDVYPSDREIAEHFGDWDSPRRFGIAAVEDCLTIIKAAAREGLEQVELYDGAVPLLERAGSLGRVALLSSSTREPIINGLKHNGLEDAFDVVLTAEDVTHHKPHPEIIHSALALMEGKPQRAVMVGDSHKDLGAAVLAGTDSALVHHPGHEVFYDLAELRRGNPTYTVRSLPELHQPLFD